MVRIRLKRMGAKARPFYRVIVADQRSPRDGRVIEELGWYNPLTEPFSVSLSSERVDYWLQRGAQPTATVQRMLKKQGIIKETKVGGPSD